MSDANLADCSQAVVMRPDHVTIHTAPLLPPPLVVMTLNLRTLPNPKTHQNEVRGHK